MSRRDLQAIGLLTGLGLVLVAAFAGVAAWPVDWRNHEDAAPSTPAASVKVELVAVPTGPPRVPNEDGLFICHMAGLSGVLVAHPDWGITVGNGQDNAGLIFWPHGYVGRKVEDRLELLDQRGMVVARVGDFIRTGGGMATINGLEGFAVCGSIEVELAAADPQ